MSDKPTQQMFDMLVEQVMFNLRVSNCFGEPDAEIDEGVIEFYEEQVWNAVVSVFNPRLDVVAVYSFTDINDRLDAIYGYDGWDRDTWDERRMEILRSVVRSSEMNRLFEHLVDEAITSGF